jgi:potassium-transporting ATPase KdpC subunit
VFVFSAIRFLKINMIKEIIKYFKSAIAILIVMTLLTGIVYPFVVSTFAHILFPNKVDGSLIVVKKKTVGSNLIGQNFDSPKYFWGRPSATTSYPYNTLASGGSNLGPTNPALLAAVKHRIEILRSADPTIANKPIPVDLVTASGSGLDPDISPAAAYFQIHRIAVARNLPDNVIKNLITKHITGRQFGILGEPRVNVLELNLALDALTVNKK